MLQQLSYYNASLEEEESKRSTIQPETFLEQVDQFSEGLNVLLSQYQKVYVLSKMQPTNEEYQQQLDRITDGIQQVGNRTQTLTANIQTLVGELNREMLDLNKSIQQQKKRNAELKRQLGMVNSQSNAAEEMVDDYQYINKMRYIRNWSLGLSVLACFYMIYKNTRATAQPSNSGV